VQQTASNISGSNRITFSRFVSRYNRDADYFLVTGGQESVSFWKLEGAMLSKKQGRFGRKYKQTQLLCAANIRMKEGWQVVVGTATGDLYVYSSEDRREVANAVDKAHSGAVLCLAEGNSSSYTDHNGGSDSGSDSGEGAGCCTFLVSGGADGMIKIWNSSLQLVGAFGVSFQLSPKNCAVSALDVMPYNTSLLSSNTTSSATASNTTSSERKVESSGKSSSRSGGGGGTSSASSSASAGSDSNSDHHRSIVLLVGTVGGEIIELRSDSQTEPATMKSVGLSQSGSIQLQDVSVSGRGGGSREGEGSGGGQQRGSGAVEVRNMDISSATAKVLVHSHSRGELWGLVS
jgi:hypothetical protein